MASKAYNAGYRDGLAWDLDGFADRDALTISGWDEATINAIGVKRFAKSCGLRGMRRPGGEIDFQWDGGAVARWERACEEYNEGALAGARAPQNQRTGLPTQANTSHA